MKIKVVMKATALEKKNEKMEEGQFKIYLTKLV